MIYFFHYAIADTFRKYREKLTSQVPSTVEAKVSISLTYPDVFSPLQLHVQHKVGICLVKNSG